MLFETNNWSGIQLKEEELRASGDPKFSHLMEDLHVEISAYATPAEAHARIAYALAEVRRFLVPVSRFCSKSNLWDKAAKLSASFTGKQIICRTQKCFQDCRLTSRNQENNRLFTITYVETIIFVLLISNKTVKKESSTHWRLFRQAIKKIQ